MCITPHESVYDMEEAAPCQVLRDILLLRTASGSQVAE
jgi:hypothetical protein